MNKLLMLLKENWFLVILGVAVYWIFNTVSKRGVFGLIKDWIFGVASIVSPQGAPVNQSGLLDYISDDDAKRLAKILHNAMKDVGTDEGAIDDVYRNLVGRTGATAQVYNAFGSPPYQHFGEPLLGKGTECTLYEWFKYEISGNRLANWLKLFSDAKIL